MCKDDGGRIEGYVIVFGDKDNFDLQGEYFTEDTEFKIIGEYPIVIDNQLCGFASEICSDSIGMKVKGILDLSIPISQAAIKLAREGKMFLAPASDGCKVDVDGEIVDYPISFFMMTPTPVQTPKQRHDAIDKGEDDAL